MDVMSVKEINNNKTERRAHMIADTPYKIDLLRLLYLRRNLRLEVVGLKGRGRSAYSLIKEIYGLKGSKQRVLEQFTKIIEDIKVKEML